MEARITEMVSKATFKALELWSEGTHRKKVSIQGQTGWDNDETGVVVGLKVIIDLEKSTDLADLPQIAAEAGRIVKQARIAAGKGSV